MASLYSIAELAHEQCYPSKIDPSPITADHFIEDAILEYAYQLQLLYWKEKREEGYAEMPSFLLAEKEVEVVDGYANLCNLDVFRAFSSDVWLQQVGEVGCEYMRHTVNASKLLVDEDDRGNQYKTYIPIGDKLKFPDGVYSSPVKVIIATKGEGIDGDFEVDEVVGNIVRDRLVERWLGKQNQVDVTNNSNPVI